MNWLGNFAFRVCVIALTPLIVACDNSEQDTQPDQFTGTLTPEQLLVLEANTTLRSGVSTPNVEGTFDSSLSAILKGNYQDDLGNGYAFELGRDGTAFSAMVGLLPSTDVGSLPLTGVASMSGDYQVIEVGKSAGDLREYGEPVKTTGRVVLLADFKFGTLNGSDDTLNVDGQFSDKALTGNVYFNGRQATLSGEIGGSRAVGIFHGFDSATTYVGGFVVDR